VKDLSLEWLSFFSSFTSKVRSGSFSLPSETFCLLPWYFAFVFEFEFSTKTHLSAKVTILGYVRSFVNSMQRETDAWKVKSFRCQGMNKKRNFSKNSLLHEDKHEDLTRNRKSWTRKQLDSSMFVRLVPSSVLPNSLAFLEKCSSPGNRQQQKGTETELFYTYHVTIPQRTSSKQTESKTCLREAVSIESYICLNQMLLASSWLL
jgi:hypothetical protein